MVFIVELPHGSEFHGSSRATGKRRENFVKGFYVQGGTLEPMRLDSHDWSNSILRFPAVNLNGPGAIRFLETHNLFTRGLYNCA